MSTPDTRPPASGGQTAVAESPARRAAHYDVRSPAMLHPGFVVTSDDVKDGGEFTARQEGNTSGCDGANVSPQLSWVGAPEGTRSYAVTMFDPDAPTGSGFWHWVVYNLPAATTSLPAGAGSSAGSDLPRGAVQGATDNAPPGYGGPCPPPGDGAHRYLITVHALKADRVDIPQGATAAVVGFTLHPQTLATASLTAHYGRPAAPGATSDGAP